MINEKDYCAVVAWTAYRAFIKRLHDRIEHAYLTKVDDGISVKHQVLNELAPELQKLAQLVDDLAKAKRCIEKNKLEK